MSLFSEILSKIFSHAAAATSPAATGAPVGAAPAPVPTPATPATVMPSSSPTPATTPTITPAMPATAGAAPQQPVDVAAVLDGLAAKNSESLDWKKSIVDLMKLVGMDSSLSSRKQLAEELHYSGDMGDSASMNVWLHKEVLQKISENGGKVPAELLAK